MFGSKDKGVGGKKSLRRGGPGAMCGSPHNKAVWPKKAGGGRDGGGEGGAGGGGGGGGKPGGGL